MDATSHWSCKFEVFYSLRLFAILHAAVFLKATSPGYSLEAELTGDTVTTWTSPTAQGYHGISMDTEITFPYFSILHNKHLVIYQNSDIPDYIANLWNIDKEC